MAPRIVITEAALLAALAEATKDDGPEDAQTVKEIAERTKHSEKLVRRALQAAKAQGRLQRHTIYREGLDGRRCQVTGYTIA